MARATIPLDDSFAELLRASRMRTRPRLSQKAAADVAGVSEVYWSKIESGAKDTADLDYLCEMCIAVRVPVRALEKSGHHKLAEAVQNRLDWFMGEANF